VTADGAIGSTVMPSRLRRRVWVAIRICPLAAMEKVRQSLQRAIGCRGRCAASSPLRHRLCAAPDHVGGAPRAERPIMLLA
jgi:hypothetical protein